MKTIITFLVSSIIFLWLCQTTSAEPPPNQPQQDIFPAAGVTNLQDYNPVTVKGKTFRTATYNTVLIPGCVGVDQFYDDLVSLQIIAMRDFNFNLVRLETPQADFTIYLSCGLLQSQKCSSVNIFCLPDQFPYNPDVYISDIMYSPILWPYLTRISILLHEILGHAIGTWNEQYCKGFGYQPGHPCFNLPQFTPAPNWVDFMNTGVNSRHEPGPTELRRWEDTMYLIQVIQIPTCDIGDPNQFGHRYDSCEGVWLFPDGGKFKPNSGCGEYYLPDGRLMWGGCDTWGGGARWNDIVKLWLSHDGGIFNPATDTYINIGAGIVIP